MVNAIIATLWTTIQGPMISIAIKNCNPLSHGCLTIAKIVTPPGGGRGGLKIAMGGLVHMHL